MIKLYTKSFIFYIVLTLYSIIGSRFIEVDNSYQEDMFNEYSHTGMITIFFVGALFETFIFNFLILYFLRFFSFFRRNGFILIIIASILFGLGHFSSIDFVIVTFFAGVILNWNFILYVKKINYTYAFITTFLLHFLSNLTLYLYDISLN